MSATRTLTAAACLALLAGCGSSPASTADATSFEEAIGLDQASLNAREAKVQELVRTCMKAQGFEYVPIDPSQGEIRVSIGGVGDDDPGLDDPEFRRTKGYGITTRVGQERPADGADRTDPNRAIREQLSEADQEAYDQALYGELDVQRDEGGGGVMIRRRAEGGGEQNGPSDQGCFGQAQKEVPGGPATIGDSLRELDERIKSDPRLIEAQRAWATCMAESGYDQFETREEIPEHLIGELQKISGAPPEADGDGPTRFAIGGDIDQEALSKLQREELSLAQDDYTCIKETGGDKVYEKVRDEARERFLDEHPDLPSGS